MRARASITAVSAATVLTACGSPGPPESGSGGGTFVSLRVTTSGDGLVRGTGDDCRGSCTLQVANGTKLQLQAIPDAGASFDGWTGACTGNRTACAIAVDGDDAVTAAFSRPGPVQVPPQARFPRFGFPDHDGSFRVDASGTGFTSIDDSDDFNRGGPRVDYGAVYCFHAGSLLKRLK